jgi:hypothetical protein
MRRAPVSCPGALLGVAAPSYGPTCRTKTLAGSDPWVMVKNGNTADPSEPSPGRTLVEASAHTGGEASGPIPHHQPLAILFDQPKQRVPGADQPRRPGHDQLVQVVEFRRTGRDGRHPGRSLGGSPRPLGPGVGPHGRHAPSCSIGSGSAPPVRWPGSQADGAANPDKLPRGARPKRAATATHPSMRATGDRRAPPRSFVDPQAWLGTKARAHVRPGRYKALDIPRRTRYRRQS